MSKELIKLCVDTARNSVKQYSQKDGNEAVRQAFIEIMGTDKPDHKTFRRHKNEIFEIIEVALDEVLTSGWGTNTFFDTFVEYKSSRLGDKNEFTSPDNSILTVARNARGVLDLKKQRLDSGDSFNIPVSTYSVAIVEDYLRMVSGRMDWSALVAKVQKAYEEKLKNDIYAAFTGSIAYLPAEFKKTGSFTTAKLSEVVAHVKAANGNSDVIIVGTPVALGNVYGTPDITWSDTMRDEYNRTGKIAFWRGIPCLEVEQIHKQNTFTFALDDSQIYVIPVGTEPIKVMEEGDAIIRENNDGEGTKDMSVTYLMVKEFGISCIFNTLYGILDLDA